MAQRAKGLKARGCDEGLPGAARYLGRALWRNRSGYTAGLSRNKDASCKLLDQRLTARDFDRQVAEVQMRVAILNGYIALGIPVTKAVR